MFLLDVAGRRLARYLTAPRRDRVHSTTASATVLAQTLRVGDVLLVASALALPYANHPNYQQEWKP
ncbi:MAG: DUF6221 family protein, partial [Gemmatimonadota bacterium]